MPSIHGQPYDSPEALENRINYHKKALENLSPSIMRATVRKILIKCMLEYNSKTNTRKYNPADIK